MTQTMNGIEPSPMMILRTDHKPTFLPTTFKAGTKVTVVSSRGDTWIVSVNGERFSIKKEKLSEAQLDK
jgi:hypothetical protein